MIIIKIIFVIIVWEIIKMLYYIWWKKNKRYFDENSAWGFDEKYDL